MLRFAVAAGASLGATGVAAGAFGAHSLGGMLTPDSRLVFETAARYQLLHALALLGAGGASLLWPGRSIRASIVCFIAGTILFSGSLYALSLSGVRALGVITPVGGLLLIVGWLLLFLAALRGAATKAG